MITWSQIRRHYKKLCFRMLSFLFLLLASWCLWVWMIPPQPRAIVVPFKDSDFVAFTSDSKLLISREPQWHLPPGEMDWRKEVRCPSRIQVWDARSGTLLRTFSDEWADMDRVIPSQDSGRLIGWASGKPGKSPDVIMTCDLRSGEVFERVTLPAKYWNWAKIVMSPDDRWLGIEPTSGFVEQFRLWRIGSNQLMRFDGIGPRLTFSENGEFLAASGQGASEFRVEVWRLNDLTKPWKKHKWPADQGFVFPDCRTAATYRREDFKIAEAKLWDLATGRLLATFPAGDSKTHIRFLDFPPHGKIVTDYVDWTASTAIWDVTGQPKLNSVLNEWRIAISQDRKWLLQSEETGVYLVGLQSGSAFSLTHSSDSTSSNAGAPGLFSSDSTMVVVTNLRRELNNQFVQWLASFLPIKSPNQWGPVARLWDVQTGAELAAFDGSTEAFFSPDSKTLATLQEDGTLRLWDIPGRTSIWRILSTAVALWLFFFVCFWVGARLRRGAALSTSEA
jgi:WD40 repeat protein